MSERPVFSDVGVVALVPDRFEGAWQPRHQVMTRLSRYFRVAWLQPPSSWRKVLSARQTKDHLGAPPPEGFTVHDPSRVFPKFYRPRFLGEATARARIGSVVASLRRSGVEKIVLYLWRPEFGRELDRVEHDTSCYHIDDEYSFSEQDRPVSDTELEVLRRVDQVFIHSPALLEKKGHLNPNTAFVPNGVDYDAFATPVPEPADLAAVPRPRVGYLGFLKKQLDWGLLEALASRHEEWSFVFVGPRQRGTGIEEILDRVASRPNAHFLGPKSISEVGAYPQHFDVSILPYVMNDYTRYINPLKFYEYLAAGPPIVGVPIRTLKDFPGVISLAKGVEEWSSALGRSLHEEASTAPKLAERRSVAKRYDWDVIVHGIACDLVTHLGRRLPSLTDSAAE